MLIARKLSPGDLRFAMSWLEIQVYFASVFFLPKKLIFIVHALLIGHIIPLFTVGVD